MAIELATAYVSVVPSTQGIASQLRREMGPELEQAGREGGQQIGNGLTAVGGRVAMAGGLALAAGFGAALTRGFGRLRAIDDARFKLAGLGHDAEMVDTIMESALASVLGTAYGLGEAATIAASAVAAGVEPGDELTRTLSLTGDAATIAGTSLGDMGSIFGKISASNRMMTQEMNQLQDRGLPVLSWLQDEYGISADAARDMVSSGAVDFATFQRLIEKNIGGAALTAGESFSGSLANVGAAVGRLGAAFLGPAFAAAPAVFGSIISAIDMVTNAVGPLVERFSGPLAVTMGVAATIITAVLVPAMIVWATQATISAARAVVAWVTAQLASIKSAAIQAVSVARVIAGWVLMGVQSMIQAARVAAAWVIAMGPVGWVIATVVGLVGLIVANWDTVVAATGVLRDKVVGFITGMRDGAANIITDLFDRVRGIKDTVLGFFSNAGSWLWNAGRNIIQGLIDGAGSLLRNIGSFFLNMVPGWIRGPFEKALGISSPSKVFAGYGVDIMQGLQVGMDSFIPTVPAVVPAGRVGAFSGPVMGGDGAFAGSHYHLHMTTGNSDADVREQFRRMELING